MNTALTPSAVRVELVNGLPTTTSLDVAEHFGKRHDTVLRAIRQLDCSPEFNARNFAGVEYTDDKGERRPMYRITRDGFTFLCMGFTGPQAARWKEAYIEAFNRLEAEASPLPQATGPQPLPLTDNVRRQRFIAFFNDDGQLVLHPLDPDSLIVPEREANRLYGLLGDLAEILAQPVFEIQRLGVDGWLKRHEKPKPH